MRKRCRHIILFFLLQSFLFCAYAQQSQPSPSGGFSFHGTIGHADKPLAVMVSSIPENQRMAECSFYKGDSLAGFDFTETTRLAGLDGVNMYFEYKAFMFKKESEFVKKKYNISALPFEISARKNAVTPPVLLTSACTNSDFENNDFSSWVTARGYNANSSLPLTVMASPAMLNAEQSVHSCDDLNIISAAYGNDPYGAFPGLDPLPGGGAHSARIGGMDMNTSAGIAIMLCDANKYMTNGINIPSNSNGEELSQTFLVTAANALITYDYAVVLNAGAHAAGEQPYFHAIVTDAGGTLLNACTEYYVQAIAGVPPPGFVNLGQINPADGSALYSLSWVSNSVNLTSYIGTTVILKFSAAGCIYGGHMAWAYIDVSCGPVNITVTNPAPCVGGTSTLVAPTVNGGSYVWTGPSIVGTATSQSVTVNGSGTYSVTITPSQGPACAYALTQAITFNSPSVSSTSSTLTNCTSPTGSATANVSGGTGTYTYAWTPGGQTTQTATGLNSGNYTVTITDANGCTAVATQSVSSFPPVVAAYSVTTVCLGSPTQFTDQSNAAATSWSWNFGDASAANTSQNPTHTYTASGVFTATLTSTGAGGCNSTITHLVTVNPLPVANFSVTTVCLGNPTQFTDQSTGGGTSWSWNFGDGSALNTSQSPAYTYTASGTYTATLISTGPGGCNSSIPKVVTVYPQPAANFSVTTVCFGMPTVFSDQSTGGANAWSWNFGDGSALNTTQNPSYTYSVDGTYTVSMTATANPGGCNSTVTQVVTVYPQPIANFSVTTVCFGNTTQFTDISTGGGTIWAWNFGDGSAASAVPSPTHTYTAAGTYTATLLVTGVGGCSENISHPVIVNIQPAASFTVAPLCLNIPPAIFNDLSTSASQWTWSFGDGTPNSTQQNTTHVYGATGTYSVTLVVQAAGGCKDSVVHTITVNPVPDATFISNVVCFNNPTQFTDQSLGAPSQWDWNFGDGNTGTGATPSHTYNAPGTYTVTMIATNSSGCSDTIPLTALVNPLPVANFTADTVCVGNSTCFKDKSNITPPSVITTWSWNFNDPASGANNISNFPNPCHIFTAAGNYNVILTVTSNDNCQSTVNQSVLVTVPPAASFTATTVCLNSPTNFTDGSSGASVWHWNFGDGNTSTQQNPSHTYLGYGQYIVTLIVSASSTSTNCADTATAIITVNPIPIVTFTSDSVCLGKPSSFTDASFIPSGNITGWHWDFGDPASGTKDSSSLQNPTHIFTASGTFTVTLTASSSTGCAGTKSFIAFVYPGPVANFSYSPVSPALLTDLVSFTDLSTGSPNQWWWGFGDGDTSIAQNPAHSYPDVGTYTITLIVMSQNGCSDTIMKPIDIKEFVFNIPNAFTPNGDGKNDYFFGKGIGIKKYEMFIFDRWGNLIFYCKIDDLPQRVPCMWDGKVEAGNSNLRVQEDVYVWKVYLTDVFDVDHSYIGSVTIVR